MSGLMDRALEINHLVTRNVPSTCRVWEPIYSGKHIRFRLKCKNLPVLCVELTYEQVMDFRENEVAALLTANFIRLMLERIDNYD